MRKYSDTERETSYILRPQDLREIVAAYYDVSPYAVNIFFFRDDINEPSADNESLMSLTIRR